MWSWVCRAAPEEVGDSVSVSATYPTLEHVAQQARPYPTHVLVGAETGLVLFAAAFQGHNDAVHFAEAGLKTMCVDIDGPRLAEMAQVYPDDWQFAVDDAWKFADAAYTLGEQWDVVSADTFTGDVMHRSLDSLPLWCSLARRAVTVTLTVGEAYKLPEGWLDTQLYERATGVYWLVLERR